LDGRDGRLDWPESVVNELLGLVAFAFAGSVSPGPNNAILWASGLRFGYRRTLSHVLGTALGIGALVVVASLGIGELVQAVPALKLALKLAGSAYLLWLAYLVARSESGSPSTVASPLGLWQAVAFQWVNPKGWIFALTAVGTFLPRGLHRAAGVGLATAVLMGVVVVTASIWALGGAALSRWVDDPRSRRVVSIVLAVLLAGSVALIWI
jgi:threonine/homoserine/homoserine lactone efflux protein